MRLLPLSLLAALCSLAVAGLAEGAPVISEFMAENKDTVKDVDGDTSDWLEIYNPDDAPVSLAGMALTDNAALPQKWIIPDVSLAPKATLLVWCSGKNRTNPAAELHTNFQLAKEGGYLALVAVDGVTRLSEWSPYPAQVEDRSYGSAKPVVTLTPIIAGAGCRWRVPTSAIANWEKPAFVDTAWTAGQTGIGFDTDTTSSTSYKPAAGNGLISATGTVPTGTASCYVRIPFTVTSPGDVQTLTLRMKYDDGFAAFLNGTRLNPPTADATNAPATLAFNSTAIRAYGEADAFIFKPFDISDQRSLLVEGTNILAIQALNQTSTSSDLLMLPELEVTKVDNAAAAKVGYFKTPTPGTGNSAQPVDGFVDAPDYSVKRGFFTAPVTVTLTSKTPEAQIRYTTNGTAPTATTGTVYTAPVTISGSSVLRAGAFRTGWEPSVVKSHTYIFPAQVVSQPAAPAGYPTTWGNTYDFNTGTLTGAAVPADYRMDPGITGSATYGPLIVPALTTTLPVISIAVDVSQIFATNGIYSNGRITPGVELPASMEFWAPGGKENWQENMGLRMHGGDAPLEHPKKPFRVYFRKSYGVGKLDQPQLFPGSPVSSFDKLQLRPGGHDGWSVPFGSGAEDLARHAVYCRDRFLRQTELDMGRLSHRGRYAHLYINGLYWGFYDLHEVQSKEFFADHVGGEEEDWDVVEHSNTSVPLFSVVDGTGDAMDTALSLVRPPTNVADPAVYAQLQAYINYDELIDNMIVNMWGGQNDWLGPVFRGVPGVNLTDASRFFNKNWEAGRRSRGPDPSPFYFQVWDAEISMGNSLSGLVSTMRVADFNHTLVGTPTTDTSDTRNTSRTAGVPGPAAEIYYALRKYSPAFRMKFADRLQRHFFNDGAMTVDRNQARLQRFRDLLDLPIVAESARWGDVNTNNPIVVTFNRDTHWRSEMDWLKNTYVATRNETLLSQFRAIDMWPVTTAPVFSQFGGNVPSDYALGITDPNPAGGVVYYTLDGTDPMVPGGVTETSTLIGTGINSTSQYIVPSANYGINNTWKNLTPPADISSWSTGTVALGFDANPTFTPHITTTVAGMRNVNSSLYIRIPFTVTAEQKATMKTLSLRLKYDDGVYVFLNGSPAIVRINDADAGGNSKDSLVPKYNDSGLISRPDAEAVNFQTIDISEWIPNLLPGQENILAIQGLNKSVTDDDFLCSVELVAASAPVNLPSETAQIYTGELPLAQSGTVKARILKDGVWSPLTEAPFLVGVPATSTNLVISEFSYNPVATPAELAAGFTDQQFEFIELLNISETPVELTGCRFDDGISFAFPARSAILPGQRIVLVSNEAAFQSRYPGVPVFGVFANESNLSNSGERLELLNAAGGPIFDFTYDDKLPWPEAPDGTGFSLVLINPLSAPDPVLPGNWRASVNLGGSPGGTDTDTFGAWASRNGVSGEMTDDPDGNGLTNLVEYGLGIIPGAVAAGPEVSAAFEQVTVSGVADSYLVLRFRRNKGADDVAVVPEMSTDMVNWSPLIDDVTAPVSNADGTESLARRGSLPVSGRERVYVRVTVTTR